LLIIVKIENNLRCRIMPNTINIFTNIIDSFFITNISFHILEFFFFFENFKKLKSKYHNNNMNLLEL